MTTPATPTTVDGQPIREGHVYFDGNGWVYTVTLVENDVVRASTYVPELGTKLESRRVNWPVLRTTRPVNEVTAKAEPVAPSHRPEPGPFPTLYILTWWEWRKSESKYTPDSWQPRSSRFHGDRDYMLKDGAELIAKGCRNVRLITIPGDGGAK